MMSSEVDGFTRRVASLPAGNVHYREAGEGEPIVFVHGFYVDGELWAETARRLAGSHRCIVPDWPFGSHPEALRADADLSPTGAARIVTDLLAALELDRVTLVGNDSGGAIAQVAITETPERIGRLVLTNCDAFENFPPKGFRWLGVAARVPGFPWLLAQSMRLEASLRSPLAFGRLTKRRIPTELLRRWARPSIADAGVRRDIGKFVRGIDPRYTLDAAARLAGLEQPALLAWAEEDRLFPIAHAHRLAELIGDARVEPIADAKAFVPLDQPVALAEAIAGFIAAKPLADRAATSGAVRSPGRAGRRRPRASSTGRPWR